MGCGVLGHSTQGHRFAGAYAVCKGGSHCGWNRKHSGGSADECVVGGGGEVPKDRPTKVNGFMTHTSPDGPATLCRKAGPHPPPIRFQGHGLQNRAWPDSGLSPSPASAPFAHTQRIGILSSAFPLGNGPTGCPGFRISSGVQTDGTCPRTPRDMIKR